MKNLQTIKHNAQKGFTLIELMIVVAIIGILAALAIPAYQDYTIKSRVGEGASLSGAFKTAIEIYWSENGTLSDTGTGLGGDTLGLSSVSAQYVSDISVEAGPVLEVTLRDSSKLGTAADTCFQYVPTHPDAGRNLTWSVEANACSGGASGPVASKYLPRD
ncbi:MULTISPECIES: prepilin-type N-terminal cleavage/methylation domain-containing protein [Cycloclasticus]|uniref:Type 4 fimbrial pilin signal peptide protein n=1 Tax=Cycloclasticus pugetii TaxID=34068 RepID=A0AB33YYU8_9GAMM|nr:MULTISPECIES: prepilin-type N-terminal cleavage/methylation domain-containing protein [Cycloclasticus]ATI04092.1 prepilin-type N-terminal cleavage/methylation domain-containing protein [Cycloclasticus sp. PY97N]EPD12315.1 Type 4 fimbrial pilin signal peptide protein [Cycloclasticus pugetii]